MKKGVKIWSLIVILTVVVSLFSGMVSADVTPQTDSKDKGGKDTVKITYIASPGEIAISNDNLTLYVETEESDGVGTFTLKTAEGYDLLYTSRDHDAWSSYLTVQVDGKNYTSGTRAINGTPIRMNDYVTQYPTIVDNSIVTKWALPEDIRVIQEISLVGEAAKFNVTTINEGSQSREVNVRYLFDYQVKDQDGAPIYVEGEGILTKETRYENPSFGGWYTYDQIPNPTLKGKATLSTAPYLIIFANWAWANDYVFDYDEFNSSRAFYTPGETHSPESDSCGLLYWDLGTIAAGNSENIITYYGTDKPVEEDPKDRLIKSIEDLNSAVVTTMYSYARDTADVNAKTYKKLHKPGLEHVAKLLLGLAQGSFAALPPVLHGAAQTLKEVGVTSRAVKMAYSIDALVDDIPDDATESEVSDYYFYTFDGTRTGQEVFPAFPDPHYPTDDLKDRPGIYDLCFRMEEFKSEIINNLPDQLPPEYPVDDVVRIIDDLTESVETSRIRESQIIWKSPSGEWNTGTLTTSSLIKNYDVIYNNVDSADRFEDYLTYACAGTFLIGFGAKGAAILGVIPTGGTSLILGVTAETIWTTVNAGCTLTRPMASTVETERFLRLESETALITEQLVEQISLMTQASSDMLKYVNESTQASQQSLRALSLSIDNVEIIDIQTPDIILDEEELAGSQTGVITLKNTGTTPANITAYATIYGPKIDGIIQSVGVSYQPEPLVLSPGETSELNFTYFVFRSSLFGCDKYEADIYILYGLKSVGALFSYFYAGTVGQCEIYSEQTIYVPLEGSITEGESRETTISTLQSTVDTELILTYSGSDLDLHVYDSQGRHIGVNYSTGDVEVEIPNATYSGHTAYPEMIELYDSGEQAYEIEVIAVSTSSSENFSVIVTETPIRSAMMDIIPPVIEISAYAGEIVNYTFSVSEYGGQKNITGLNLSATDLTNSESHIIPSSNLMFFIPTTEVPAGSLVPIRVTIDIPEDAIPGTYTGKINATAGNATDESIINVVVLSEQPKTIYVDDDFEDDPANHTWNTIQEGINDAEDGWTVIVYEGTYYENVMVNKSITLKGVGMPVADAEGSGSAITVTADGCTVEGFKVTRGGYYFGDGGIRVQSTNNVIRDITAINNEYGIFLWYYSSNNVLSNNIAKNNQHGICIANSPGNTLKGNIMLGNNYNFGVWGWDELNFHQDIDTSNTVDGKSIYYLVDKEDVVVDSATNAGYAAVVSSSNVTVTDLTLMNNEHGILFAFTKNSRIENIIVEKNSDGICLRNSYSNTVSNITAGNNWNGIYLDRSSDNILRSNAMAENNRNFQLDGYEESHFCQDIDTSNTVDGKPIYYLVDAQDVVVDSSINVGYVATVSSSNVTVKDLTLSNNGQGVLFALTDDSRIENVTLENNGNGIHLYRSSNNILSDNIVRKNTKGIYLSSSTGNTLSDTTVESHTGSIGIHLTHSSYNTLNNVTVKSCYQGILLDYSSFNILSSIMVKENQRNGIWLRRFSSDNTLSNIIIKKNNNYGVYLEGSSNDTLIDNTISDNGLNFYVVGDKLSHFIHNIDTSNLVNGKPIQYHMDKEDLVIDSNWDIGYLGIVSSKNITVKDLSMANNGQGVLLVNCTDSSIENVNAQDNHFGIHLVNSSSNSIKSNNLLKNSEDGIYLYKSSNNTIVNNNVSNNHDGICLYESSDSNKIYLNNFIYNSFCVDSEDSTNIWNSTERMNYTYNGSTYTNYLGNYWSDYNGSDADGDGIGNAPYSIDGDNDSYPLIEPFESYEIGAGPKTWYVDDDLQDYPDANFTNIQDAVDAASVGDTIIVYPGIYTENVDVNKSLTIKSESGAEATIVQAPNSDDHVFEVTAYYVNIRGFTVTGTGAGTFKAGIFLDFTAGYCNISYNNASNNDHGIRTYCSSNNTLSSNNVSNNRYGMYLHFFSPNNILTNNTMSDNRYNLFVQGYTRFGFTQNIDTSNMVNGKPVQYFVDRNNLVIDSSWDVGYLGLVNCTNIVVKDLTLSNNGQGVLLAYSNSSRIEGVNVSNNFDGIHLHDSSGNTLSGNAANSNDRGLILIDSSSNILSSNTANSNFWGIYLHISPNNTLTDNTMSDNQFNFFVVGSDRSEFTQNIDVTNIVNGKPIQYLVDKDNLVIDSSWDVGYLGLVNCTNVVVKDLTLSNNGQGVLLAYSNSSRIEGVNVSKNSYGIYLDHSSGNILSGNTANSNGKGISIGGYSNNNIIYLNNFIANYIYNVNSYSTNIWNSTSLITYTYNGSEFENYLGNYWDDYKEKYPDAEEIDGTGIWDTPYSIVSENDTYPLMGPWENYFAPTENIFDTGSSANPYPSIMGNHTGTIKPNHTVIATKLYTYPCTGTGGHTEYASIGNKTWNATATWEGYIGDWQNITFDKNVVLLANETYNYTIRTGSYPQIHHTGALPTENGWINCTKFTDANGRIYTDWIPAIRLE